MEFFKPNPKSSKFYTTKSVVPTLPKKRHEVIKWNGWGYNDSKYNADPPKNAINFTGSRYPIASKKLPNFRQWTIDVFDIAFEDKIDPNPMPTEYPAPKINQNFLENVKEIGVDWSVDGFDRLTRAHGQEHNEIYTLRTGMFQRIPDLILWPIGHDQVLKIVESATKNDVCLIPFGGGTSVSGAVLCPEREQRSIVVVDTTQMNKMLWLDKSNFIACFESGIIGQDLEKVLNGEGLTLGHDPDSIEFSTLGGWVSTRASGMKKNVYGNIEDIVIQIKVVTPKGVYQRNITGPRVSCGPDFNQIILGSEGTLGIITEVTLKVRPLPVVQKYGSLIFPDFEIGIECLREIAEKRCQPASIRLMDNEQFVMGQTMKIDAGFFGNLIDKTKMFMLSKVKGYDLKKLSVVTLLFEGDKEQVEFQEKRIYRIAEKYHGLNAGESNGQKGYTLTYVIAYIRDFAFDYGIISDSFETSISWEKCAAMCRNTKSALAEASKKYGLKYFISSHRVTQTYDTGCCVYFYIAFKWKDVCDDPVGVFNDLITLSRDQIIASGGTISHHHGVGTARKRWYKQSVSQIGVDLYKAIKLELDPKNTFGLPNLLDDDDKIDFEKLRAKL